MIEDRQMCLDAGMDDYLSKPVLKEKLAAMLLHWASAILTTQQAQLPAQISPTDVGSHDLLIDWQHLHQLSESNPEFELELLQIFVEDAQFHLEATEAAIATNRHLVETNYALHEILVETRNSRCARLGVFPSVGDW